MSIYAIGDLHLSGEPPQKPMEIFGEEWQGHKEKIKTNWLKTITENDTVIVCGDISWALTLSEAAPDLEWLRALPGRKLLLRGNHDYWWASLEKMQQTYGDSFAYIQNNCFLIEDTVICGSRGWKLPSAENFYPKDKRLYEREAVRLELSLKAAAAYAGKEIIVAMHYPPLFTAEEHSLFTDLMEKYPVRYCVYGHLHGKQLLIAFEGLRSGINYKLVSSDTQNFEFYKIK